MRVGLLGPVGLLLFGCSSPSLRWHDDIDRARAAGKQLYVLSLFGDLTKKC